MAPGKLDIKVKALQRLVKEKSYYVKELEEQESALAALTTNRGDEYEIKKQGELVAETKRMLPELDIKISKHKEELAKFIEGYKGEESLDLAKSLL